MWLAFTLIVNTFLQQIALQSHHCTFWTEPLFGRELAHLKSVLISGHLLWHPTRKTKMAAVTWRFAWKTTYFPGFPHPKLPSLNSYINFDPEGCILTRDDGLKLIKSRFGANLPTVAVCQSVQFAQKPVKYDLQNRIKFYRHANRPLILVFTPPASPSLSLFFRPSPSPPNQLFHGNLLVETIFQFGALFLLY